MRREAYDHDGMHVFLSLVIPAYNEERRIQATLEVVESYLAQYGTICEIIAVNDGSTDSTLDILRECAARSRIVRVLDYSPNRGKGHAVRQGMLAARGDFVAFSDADLSAPIEDLSKLFDEIDKGYDVAIGSRAMRESKLAKHQPRYRELGGRMLNRIVQIAAVPGIKDTQCGFKLFTHEASYEIFSRCFLNGWGFDIEVLYLARRLGYRISEVPVVWAHAEDSKIHPFKAGLQILKDLVRIRLHNYRLP